MQLNERFIYSQAINMIIPIVSGINSVTYGLAKYLAKLLNPLVRKSKYHIKNSEYLAKLLKEINLMEDDVFISYDVTAHFTSVPCDEVVDIAVDRPRRTLSGTTELNPHQKRWGSY